MPTIIAHAVFAWSVVTGTERWLPRTSRRALSVAATLLAVLPDADVLAMARGVPYGAPLGHRGLTHSLLFAATTSAVVTLAWRARYARGEGDAAAEMRHPTLRVALVITAVAASHPLLDMLTNGGLGCALLAPFSWMRLFFPWRPIPVSPIGVAASLAGVLGWEALFFVPVAVAAALTRDAHASGARRLAVGGLLLVPLAVGLWRTGLA